MKNYKTIIATVAAGLACTALTASANLVSNGDFESTTSGLGQLAVFTDVTGWTASHGYNFVFNSATATQGVGVPGEAGNVSFWGTTAASPTGGNFVAMDGPYNAPNTLSQTINGLQVGSQYLVSFWFAAAQQVPYYGATETWLSATLGSDTLDTAHIFLPNTQAGSSPWQQANLIFTASSASETLSFLAHGLPGSSEPPFALLDGVTMNVVPEPTTIFAGALLLLPFGASVIRVLRKKSQA